MKTIRKLFFRPMLTASLVMLVLAFSVPLGSAVASPLAQVVAPKSDDFNLCAFNSSVWTLENPKGVSQANPKIDGAFSGDSRLVMGVPAGQSLTFSDQNMDAPRLLQKVSDESFEVEVKFMAPIRSDTTDWKIMGFLARDATTPASPKWYRFDVNSRNGGLNAYMGYLEGGDLIHIQGVSDLPGGNPASGPIVINVKYDKTASLWTVTYLVGNEVPRVYSFNEANVGGTGLGSPFAVTDIGFFVASSGDEEPTTAPGHTAIVDYFRNVNASGFEDDGIVLTVNKVGTGLGEVNWPMTSPTQCSGTNTVSLTATAATGSHFAGWSGSVVSSNPTIQVVMSADRSLTATFDSGPGGVLQFFIPIIRK